MVIVIKPDIIRMEDEAEDRKQREEAGYSTIRLRKPGVTQNADPVTHVSKDPSDEFKPSTDTHVDEAKNTYDARTAALLQRYKAMEERIKAEYVPEEERKKLEEEQKEKEKKEAQSLLDKIEKAGEEAWRNFQDFLRGVGSYISSVFPFTRIGGAILTGIIANKAAQENPSPEVVKAIKKYAEVFAAPEVSLVDSAPGAAAHLRDVLNGVRHGMFGGGDPVDLARELAAVKATGGALMQTGMALTAPAGVAAGIVGGGPAGAAVLGTAGAMTLAGWALTDNVSYWISSRLEQAKKELRDRIKLIEETEREQQKRERWAEAQKKEREEWMESMKGYLEEKKKMSEEEKKEWEQRREEEKKWMEEYLKRKQEAFEEYRKFMSEEEAKKKAKEEAKKAEYQEYLRFENVSKTVEAGLGEIKGLMSAADNAYFAKNPDMALDNLERAYNKILEIAEYVANNKEILDKYQSYEWIMASLESLANVIEAKAEAFKLRNPTYKVVNAVNSAGKASYHRRNSRKVEVRRVVSKPTLDLDDIVALARSYLEEVKTNTTLDVLNDLVKNTAETYKVTPIPASPLSWETIVKFRAWLASNIKTPLAGIPNYAWNKASGYSYTPEMIKLIYDTLREIPVMPEEVAGLEPRDLEAILRARQYIYAASKRGFFNPYEYELYQRLKKLLQLTDYQAAKLLKLYIPLKKTSKVGG
jgi:hypothetical protein